MKNKEELIENIKSKIRYEKDLIKDIEKNGEIKNYIVKDLKNRKKRIIFYEECIDEIDNLYKSLINLTDLAQYDTSGSKIAAQFLLSIYNSKFSHCNLRDLRLLDDVHWIDVINVLKLDRINAMEIHQYLEDGTKIFHQMIYNWGRT